MHHAIVFNYCEFGAQSSDMLDMSQFTKISITKCSHREATGNNIRLSRNRRTKYAKSL